MVSYDMNTGREIERYGDDLATEVLPLFHATLFEGLLYIVENHKAGAGGERQHSVWGAGRRLFTAARGLSRYSLYPLVADSNRQLIYQEEEGNLRVFKPGTLELLWVQPLPFVGPSDSLSVLGHDPKTEQLYFLMNGELQRWSTDHIQPPQPEPIAVSVLSRLPVNIVAVSPDWPEDKTLLATLGTWYDVRRPNECDYLELATWSIFFMSTDGGITWGRPRGGLQANCMYVRDVAFSFGYTSSHVISAYVVGKGYYHSVDQGKLWQPAAPLGSVGSRPAILPDPCFVGGESLFGASSSECTWNLPALSNHKFTSEMEADFLYSANGVLYRSEDGGENWIEVLQDNDLRWAQIVYAQDAAFIVTRQWWLLEHDIEQNQGRLYRTLNKGLTWELLVLPDHVIPTALAISPDFINDHLIFVGTADGRILSLDGLALPAASPTP
jgi:hypothetical protein